MTNSGSEQAYVVTVATQQHIVIVHQPSTEQPINGGIIIVSGGYQYRVGAHRLFVHLARSLTKQGYFVARFDLTGIGDSSGQVVDYLSNKQLIQTVIEQTLQQANCSAVTLLGLCDGATAALYHFAMDSRVNRFILLNPWTMSGESLMLKTEMKHYYFRKLVSKQFWYDLARGRLYSIMTTLSDLGNKMLFVLFRAYKHKNGAETINELNNYILSRLSKPTLIVLSDNDLTAKRFKESVAMCRYKQAIHRNHSTSWHELVEADHTFSQQQHKDSLAQLCRQWLLQTS